MRWRAPPAEAILAAPLDAFVAVFHRPSGATHLLAEPAPQILAALAEPASIDELARRLAVDYDLGGDREALAARVEELAAAGLAEAV